MAKSTERTSFTKDVQGRYLCNDLTEVNAWKNSGGRPFDVLVIGGETFGAAIQAAVTLTVGAVQVSDVHYPTIAGGFSWTTSTC